MKPTKLIATLIVSGGLLATSQAATLTWTDSAFTASTQISTTGTQLTSYNFGGASITVNGEAFTGILADPTPANRMLGDTYLRWGTNDTYTDDYNAYGYGTALGVTGMSAGDEVSLLNTGFYGNTQGIGVQLEGLTIGNTYTIQTLLVDNRAGQAARQMHYAQDGTTWTGGVSILVDYTSNGTTPYARLVETTFVADSATQAYRNGISGTGEMQVNAFQLRDVTIIPEPSSTALLGLGGLALILRRRK